MKKLALILMLALGSLTWETAGASPAQGEQTRSDNATANAKDEPETDGDREEKGFFKWWMLGPAITLTILLLFICGIIYAAKTKPPMESMPTPTKKFIIVTAPDIPGKKIVRVLGLVRGNTIRARHVGKDIMAGLRNIVGGEVSEYAKLLAESREQAIDRMLVEAEGLGANAIISLQFQTSVIMGGAAEMMAYGTAVVIEDE